MSKAVILSLLVIQLVFALPLDHVGNWQSSSPAVVQGRRYTSAPSSGKRDSPDPLQYDVVRSPKLVVLGEEESVEHVTFHPETMCVDISLNTDAYSWVSSRNIGLDTILNGVSTQAFLIHVDRQLMIQPNSVHACGYSTDLSEAFETATISFNQDTPSVSSKAERFGGDVLTLYGVKPNDVYTVGHNILVSFEGAGASAAGEILVFANGAALAAPKFAVNGPAGKADIVVPAEWASNTAVYHVEYHCTNAGCSNHAAVSPTFTVPAGSITISLPDEEFVLDPTKVNSVLLRWDVTGYPANINMRGFMKLYRVGDDETMTDTEIKSVVINSADVAQKSKVFLIDDVKDMLIVSPWSYYFKYSFSCVGEKCYYANSPTFAVPLSYSHNANPGLQVIEDRDCSNVNPDVDDPFEKALKLACDANRKTEYRSELTTLKASAGVTINKFEFISNYLDHYEFFVKATVHTAAEMRMEAKLDFPFNYGPLEKSVYKSDIVTNALFRIAGVSFNYKADLELFYKVHIVNEGPVQFTVPVVMPIPDVWMEVGYGTGKEKHMDVGLASEFPLVIKPVTIEGVGNLTVDMLIKPKVTVSLFDNANVEQVAVSMVGDAFATLVSEYNPDLYDALPDGYEKNYEAHYPATCNFKHRRHYTIDSGFRNIHGVANLNLNMPFIAPFKKVMTITADWWSGAVEMMVAGCLQRAQCKMFYPEEGAHLAEFCPFADLGTKCKLSCAKDYQGDKGEWVCDNEDWKRVTESTCEAKKNSKGLTTGDYVAITAGSIGGLGILAAIVVFAGKRRRRSQAGRETLMPSSITGVVVESTVIDVENPKSYGTTIAASSSSVASSSMNTTTGESDFATLPALSTTAAATPAAATDSAATGATSPSAAAAAAATPAAPATSPPVREPSPEVKPVSPRSGGAAIN